VAKLIREREKERERTRMRRPTGRFDFAVTKEALQLFDVEV
jgi:hypothetical protein